MQVELFRATLRTSLAKTSIADDGRGVRGALVILSILLFDAVLLRIGIDQASKSGGASLFALVPVLWLPLGLLALIAMHISPSIVTIVLAMVAMIIAGVVGIVGPALHVWLSGLDLTHVSHLSSGKIWAGPVAPKWSEASTLAATLGFIAAFGAQRDKLALPANTIGTMIGIGYGLIVIGIVLAAAPGMVMLSVASLAVAALLLVIALMAMFVETFAVTASR